MHDDKGIRKGALIAKGIIIGKVMQRSARMAGAIASRDCLTILGATPDGPSQTTWRILCANRDTAGKRAGEECQRAFQLLVKLSTECREPSGPLSAFDEVYCVDLEYLLSTESSSNLREFLEVSRDTVWDLTSLHDGQSRGSVENYRRCICRWSDGWGNIRRQTPL
jgi:hypothetical protein